MGIFGEQGTSLSLLALKQSFVLKTSLLLVFLPGKVDNILVEFGKILFILGALILHLLVDLITFACEMLLLFDGAVRLSIFLSQLVKHSVQFLLLIG